MATKEYWTIARPKFDGATKPEDFHHLGMCMGEYRPVELSSIWVDSFQSKQEAEHHIKNCFDMNWRKFGCGVSYRLEGFAPMHIIENTEITYTRG